MRSARAVRVAVSVLGALAAPTVFAQVGGTQLVGQVVDAATKKPVPGVIVTATSPSLQGEQVVTTDAGGYYRIPQLAGGLYALRFAKDSYLPYERPGIELRSESTIRLDVQLLPETAGLETIVVAARPPSVDVGSTTTGAQISSAFIQAVPLTRNARSFDQLALVAPGTRMDGIGLAISGTTSPENQFLVDGLSTNDVFFGLNSSPVNVEFIDQVNVITGGFMPEYGKATGGVVSAFTKSGGNEFHGSVFGTWTPGALAAEPPTILANGATFSTNTKLYNRWDAGGTLGGYIIKDRLWFFAGFDVNQVKNVRTRTTNYLEPDLSYVTCPNPNGCQPFGAGTFIDAPGSPYPGYALAPPKLDPTTGFTIAHPIPGSDLRQFSNETNYQYIAKLTFLLNPDQRFSASVIGQDDSAYGFPNTGSAFTRANAALGQSSFLDITGKWQGSFLDKRLLVDVTAGWHHQPNSALPTDDTQPGGTTGLAGAPFVLTRNYHNLTEFGQYYGPVPSQCTPITYPVPPGSPPDTLPRVFYPCPFSTNGPLGFSFGGPTAFGGYMYTSNDDSIQGTAVVTWLARALGTHVIKAGFSIAQASDDGTEAFSGGQNYVEDRNGRPFYTTNGYGVLTGPDAPVFAMTRSPHTTTTSIGGFLQDSWSIQEKVTLNIGLRYDAQSFYGTEGRLGMTLPNQWSPRIGVIWDPTYRGRSKLYANFGTYFENVPIQLGYAYFPGVPSIASDRGYQASAGVPCNPLVNPGSTANCTDPANLRKRFWLSANAGWQGFNGGQAYVDPQTQGQSTSEVVVGGEYEVFSNARVGATYTRRWMNKVIEDMSNDEAATYFIGNPGYGNADNFPKAVRNYTAVTVSFTKSFSNFWQAQLSYTYQSLVGNYEGLIRTVSGNNIQFAPNILATFDLRSLLVNSSGRLPGDITHTIKAYGSYEWVILPVFSVTFGGALTASSGTPYSYLGAHALYGLGNVYILPRGDAGTLPWVWNLDLKLGLSFRVTQDTTVGAAVDCFNVLNSAQVTTIDQNYTFATVLPLLGGTAQGVKGDPSTLRYSADHGVYQHTDDNPNFGKPAAYQVPRAFRLSARVSF